MVPALALGIPGSAPSAVLMAAMIIHGAQPGPMLMVSQPQYVYDIVGDHDCWPRSPSWSSGWCW
jgi:putative tricarboxylic transport membrane protein